MKVGLYMRRLHNVDAPRVHHNQAGPLAQALFHARRKHRVPVGRVGANYHNHVGLLHRLEGLGTGRGAIGLAQAIPGGGVADACTGIHVVIAESRTHQFLHQVGFFVGATRRGDATDRILAMFGLDAPEFTGSVIDRFIPTHLAPRVADLVANHRFRDAVFVGGITPGKTAFDA